MEFVRMEQSKNRDLELELACLECDYRVTLPLFESLFRGSVNVTHGDSEEGLPSIFVTLHEPMEDLPPSLKDYLDSLEKGI